jgi:hypothetical protein
MNVEAKLKEFGFVLPGPMKVPPGLVLAGTTGEKGSSEDFAPGQE